MKKAILAFILFMLPAVGCWTSFAQDSVTPPSVEVSDAQKRKEAFDIVWNTINERFYDPTFGGVDWKKVRERYTPLVTAAATDAQFDQLLQQMISELHQSHFVIIPKEAIPKLNPKKSVEADDSAEADEENLAEIENDESTTSLDRIGYKLTERMSTGIGIDLRVINGQAVISHVEPRSPAAQAGLRPGYVIKRVGSRAISTVIAEFESNPTFQSAFRGQLPLILLAAFINGERQSVVRLTYLDGANRTRSISIRRERLQGEMSAAIGNLPTMYTEFESRNLPNGFGYIRFNAFIPALMKKVCAALRAHRQDRGLVLDLRGNQGGLLGMIGGLTGLLKSDQMLVGVMQSRSGVGALVAYPQRMAYSGPIVILIDGSTQSAAEMFASGLQENGRAVVVGQRSAGNTLPSTIVKLPTGALFQFAFANYKTTSGQSLEGHGIEPDIIVELTRRNLLSAGDPQMTAAIKKLNQLANPKELIADVTSTTIVEPPPPVKEPLQKGVVPPVRQPVTPLPPPDAAEPVKAPTRVDLGPLPEIPSTPLPSTDEIIEHYITAIGGRAALEKLNSRVSRGTVELQSMGLLGTAEIYEQEPNKSTLLINVQGLGTIQQTYDGTIAWLQDPLDGYIKYAPASAARIRNDSTFHRELRFKELNLGLKVVAKEKLDNKDVFVLSTGPILWYFEASTGLLLRRGNTYYDDYREVDGVKLPFKVIDNTSYGFGVVVRLEEIKHNVPIDQSKFMEHPDCFTQPDGQGQVKRQK
jgi:carboxyl-terminal processing protease